MITSQIITTIVEMIMAFIIAFGIGYIAGAIKERENLSEQIKRGKEIMDRSIINKEIDEIIERER